MNPIEEEIFSEMDYIPSETNYENYLGEEFIEEETIPESEDTVLSLEDEKPYFNNIVINPRLAIFKNFHCQDIAAGDPKLTTEKFPGHWNEDTKVNCYQLLKDTLLFCKSNKLPDNKVLAFLEIFYSVFRQFVDVPSKSLNECIEFFREIMINHSVQDPPDSLEILTIADDKLLVHFFEANILPNLKLLRATSTKNSIIVVDFNATSKKKIKRKVSLRIP